MQSKRYLAASATGETSDGQVDNTTSATQRPKTRAGPDTSVKPGCQRCVLANTNCAMPGRDKFSMFWRSRYRNVEQKDSGRAHIIRSSNTGSRRERGARMFAVMPGLYSPEGRSRWAEHCSDCLVEEQLTGSWWWWW